MQSLPPLKALQTFAVTARYLSFQQAAVELDVTPTAVSHQIKVLEDDLGMPLFRRRPRPLALTKAGAFLYPKVQESFDAIVSAIAQLKQIPDHCELTVSVTPVLATKWLVSRLPQFQERYPEINLRLHTANEVVDLHQQTVDLALRYGRGNYFGLVTRPLMSDQFVPVCSPHLLTSQHPLNKPKDLAHHNLLHFEWMYYGAEAPNWSNWFARAGISNIDARGGITFNEEAVAIQAAMAGQGVALCSTIHVADDVNLGFLVQPLSLGLEGFTYSAVYLKEHPKMPLILKFVDWLGAISPD